MSVNPNRDPTVPNLPSSQPSTQQPQQLPVEPAAKIPNVSVVIPSQGVGNQAPISATVTPSIGWGSSIVNGMGRMFFGSYDTEQHTVKNLREKLINIVDHQDLNEFARSLAVTGAEQVEAASKGKKIGGLIEYEKPVLVDLIEANILNAFINLATKVKEQNPKAKLGKDEFFAEIMNLAAKGAHVQVNQIYQDLAQIEVDAHRELRENVEQFDLNPGEAEERKAAIFAAAKNRKMAKIAPIVTELVKSGFPHGSSDIINPNKKGWVDLTGVLSGLIYWDIEKFLLPNLVLDFSEKFMAVGKAHEQNKAKIAQYKDGAQLLELGNVLAGNFDRLIKYLLKENKKTIEQKVGGLHENVGKAMGSAAEKLADAKGSDFEKLLNLLGNFGEQIAMHILAKAGEGLDENEKRRILTVILEKTLNEVFNYVDVNSHLLKPAFIKYQTEMEAIDKNFPADAKDLETKAKRREAIEKAEKPIKDLLGPLADNIQKQLGIDETGLAQILPDKFSGFNAWVASWFIRENVLPNYLSGLLKGFVTDLSFQFYRDVVVEQRKEPAFKDRLAGYNEGVKTLDAIINKMMPTINLAVSDSGSDIGKIVLESLNDLFEFKADAKFLEVPIQELMKSPLMPRINDVGQNYISNALTDLFANLAVNNPDFKDSAKIPMLPAALQHILKIGDRKIKNPAELLEKIRAWKTEAAALEKMPEYTDDDKKAKANRAKELDRQKAELRKSFLPCNVEILTQGGWDNPKNIPAPEMVKSKVKDIMSEVVLSEVLFRIYSDTFVLNTLSEQEKAGLSHREQVEQFTEGAAKKAMNPIKDSIAEYGFLIASKVNQKMAGSQLSAHDEAILGSAVGQIVQAKNTTTENMWGGIQKWFGGLMNQFIDRLSLTYTGPDKGSAMANALERFKELMLTQDLDKKLVSMIQSYQVETREVKELDETIGKLQAEAVKVVPNIDEKLLKSAKPQKSYSEYTEELKGIEAQLKSARTGAADILFAGEGAASAFSNRITNLEAQKKTIQTQAYAALLKEIDQLKSKRREKFTELHENVFRQELKEAYQKLESARKDIARTAPYINDDQVKNVVQLEQEYNAKKSGLAAKNSQLKLLVEIQDLERQIQEIKNEPNKKPLLDLVSQYRGMLKQEIEGLKAEVTRLEAEQSNEHDPERKEALKSKIGDLQKEVHVRELNMGKDELLKLAEEIKVAEGAYLALMREGSLATPIFEDSARDVRAKLNTELVIVAFERHCEEKRLKFEQMPPLAARYEKILDQFRPLSKQLFADIGIKGPKDVPAPFFLQGTLLETLRDGVIPDTFMELYKAAWVPSNEAIADQQNLAKTPELKHQVELLETTVKVGADKGVEQAQATLADEKSPMPKLLADILTKQGINGLDENWFKQWMQNLSTDKGPLNTAIWDLAHNFLRNRLDYISKHMAAGGRTGDNLLQYIYAKIFNVIDTHFQNNKAAIDNAIKHYNSLPAGPLKEKYKQEAAKRLFSGLTQDVMKTLGLDKPNSTGLAFVHGTIMSTVEDFIPELCFDLYQGFRSPQAALPAIKEKLAAVIAQEKNMKPDEMAKLRDQISNTFGGFGEMIRDAVKKQLGTMTSVNEIVGIRDGKIVEPRNTEENWKKAVSGQWVLLESRTTKGKFSIVQKQRGVSRKNSPKIPLPAGPINEEAIAKSLADLQRKTLAKTIAHKIQENMGGNKGPVTPAMVDWYAQALDGILNSEQTDKAIGSIPEMVEAVVLKKLVQWSQASDMPIKPKEGESPLKYLPANVAITFLNAIDTHRNVLKTAMKKAIGDKPDITDLELQEIIKGETLKMVDELSARLHIDPKEDLPMPYANEIWESFGKSAMAAMFAKTYVDMTKVYRSRKLHKAALDARYADRKEKGHKHAGPTEATKEYTNFAMKYLKNMMVINTPGIEGGVNAVINLLKGQGKGSKGEAAGFYLEANQEAVRKWITDSNLRKVGESTEPGVEGVLWPAAQKEIRSVMLRIFDNFTGNIHALEKADPERTFNFVMDLMGMMAEHLETVNAITKEEGKTYIHDVDYALMEKRYAEKGALHPDMPGYLLRKNIRQAERLVINASQELDKIKKQPTPDPVAINAAEEKLKAAKNSLETLQNEAEAKLKLGTYQKMVPYVLSMAGYNNANDLEEVPAEHREMLWKAINESLGPEIFNTVFGEVFKPEMLNTYMLSLLEVVNDKIGKALVDEASVIPPLYIAMKQARDEVIASAKVLTDLRAGPQNENLPRLVKDAQARLQHASNNYDSIIKKVQIKPEAYKDYVPTALRKAGFRNPADLPVPKEQQQALWDKLSLKVDYPETMPKKPEVALPVGTAEEQEERQEKCRRLIGALGKALPGTVIGGLANLQMVGNLAAPVVEGIVRSSMQDWTMENIIGEAIVSGAKSLPKKELPKTEKEIAAAADKRQEDAKKTEEAIQRQTEKAVAGVRNSIWSWFNLKWKGVQKAVDGWIKRHDVNGVFMGIKSGLDKVFRKVFFDIIGTAVVFILKLPFNFIWEIYEKHRIRREAESARKTVLHPIHANVPLKGADLLMKHFPKGRQH